MWKPQHLYGQTFACKTAEVKVAWKRRNKTSRSGTIWFLTSKDLLHNLMTPDPAYPLDLTPLVLFTSGPRLSELHIYEPCPIRMSTCFFTSLC